ncbi:hypothetical protein SAMN04489860_0170 [Paraoerskovia marina]|uniref:ABC-type transport system involved in multi-copper enzyme maturation, permease component n=1 Tax=Paraoerskovia marina TaxID=545619 RepID=A0A1H1M932_9CELL|nr:hypothetical protein [Paraoerskovia marina]SDR83170.1 hypothetical protein SAMN04489860_0170 [Paraoerskovia marina]
MTAIRAWALRSSAGWLFGGLCVIVAAVIVSRSGWQWQGQWAVSWGAGTSIVLSPLLAGVVAFDVHRFLTPGLRLLTASAQRGARSVVALVVVLTVAAAVPWFAGMSTTSVRAAATGAPPLMTTWLVYVALGVAVLGAAASVGLLVGTLVPHLLAGPAAAALVYVGPILVLPLGLQGILSVGGATGPTYGMVPNPTVVAATIAVNLSLMVLCSVAALGRLGLRPSSGKALPIALVIVLAVSLVALVGSDPRTHSLTGTTDVVCTGTSPETCGPTDASAVLEVASRDLEDASSRLTAAGFTFPDEYALDAPTMPADETRGLLFVDPTTLQGDHMSEWDRGLTLATPAACPEFYGDAVPVELLDAQAALSLWFVAALSTSEDIAPTDPDTVAAVSTLDALRACDSSALPDWDYATR